MKPFMMLVAFAMLTMGSASQAETTQMGFGVGVTDTSARIRVPMMLDGSTRLEPEFALVFASGDDVDTTELSFAVGYHLLQKSGKSITTYFGGKGGVDHRKVDFDGSGRDEDDTNFFIGPVGGFEYYLAPRVTLGAEVGAFMGFGDTTSLETRTNVLLRYYFPR